MIVSAPKTRQSFRTIPISDDVVNILKQHKSKQDEVKALLGNGYRDHSLIFASEIGTPIDPRNFTRHFQIAIEKAGLPKTRFHDMRHSHATMLLTLDEHPKIVQERLGHSTIQMTLDTYSHVMPGMQEKASSRIAEVLKMDE